MTHLAPPQPRGRLGGAGIFTVAMAGIAGSVVPWMAVPVSPHPSFLPAILVLVACFDVMSMYLLAEQFRSDGRPRRLAMAAAYAWSLVVMVGYAAAFPGVLANRPPLATAPSVAPWLYVLWHTGFPVLLGLAWAPWTASMRASQPLARRRRVTWTTLAVSIGAAGLVVAVIVAAGPSLPVLIRGLDTSRMTALTAPIAVPCVLVSALWSSWALRRQSGPERWSAATVWICLFDLLLTYASGHRYSLGWYTGRGLTVVAAAVVLVAILRESTVLKVALAAALDRQRHVDALQRTILDNLSEGVFLTGASGDVVMVNAAAHDLVSGIQAGHPLPNVGFLDASGNPVSGQDLPTPRTLLNRLPLRNEILVIPDETAPQWLSVNTTPVDTADGPVVVTSFADVTEREDLLSELSTARDAAVAADQTKSAFLAAVSHEIRTPLNGILGFSGLLQRTDLDERQREYATAAQTCGEQLLGLLNDVLDFSKAEGGHLSLHVAEVDLLQLVDDAVAMVAEPARAKGLQVGAVVAADVPGRVLADGLRLRQALLNTLSNAVKFTATGSILLEVTIADDVVRFAVHDTGVGVAPDAAQRLFEPFVQADPGTARLYGGTGLGLAITRQIARLHGGEVGAQPREEGGSTFWFTAALSATGSPDPAALKGRGIRVAVHDQFVRARLEQLAWRLGGHPGEDLVLYTDSDTDTDRRAGSLTIPAQVSLRQTLAILADGQCASAAPASTQPLTGRVLVAEDNPINQRIAILLLEELGLSVHVVSDGKQAVDAALSQEFNLILMDCQMPEMDGVAATRALRERGFVMPVIALTAAASRHDEQACRAAGMNDYLTKPIDAALLAETLVRHLTPSPTDVT